MPTHHIVVVYADQRRVEHYERKAEGFECTVLTSPEASLDLGAVAFSLSLAAIYFDLPGLP